ncbi:phosphatase PAP2 family protein [Bradyrhizobium diazoefficiens]|nr:phosphatase PAP2 family protein [Bradyrhizobium diazoefficiens]MBR0777549.1 phosphatase PAP2 family protein [Bradyrhizobium diazoefficiens]MBR0852220.1 phosphatase PAP2 family protein [Bradyrhizobium diazoefficiens]
MASNSRDPSQPNRYLPKVEELISLKLFWLNWILIAIILGALSCCLLLSDFRVEPYGYLVLVGMIGIYGYFGHRNARSASRNPRVFATLFTLGQIFAVVFLLTSISYVAAAASLPMQEANLLAVDRMLGMDFRSYLDFVNGRPTLAGVLTYTYDSIGKQLFILVVLLPMSGLHRRAAEFVLGFAIALIVAILISTLVPATGAYHALGLQQADHPNIQPFAYYNTLHELPLVRDGTIRLLDARRLGTVLTFPSFHAVSAVLFAWAFWPLRWLRVIGVLWNAVMVAATPIDGGHFFADVAAGLLLALGTIYAVNRLGGHLARRTRHEPPMSPIPQTPPQVSVIT